MLSDTPFAGRRRSRPALEPLETRKVFSGLTLGLEPAPLQVVSSQLWVQGGQVDGFVIAFNRPLAPGPASNPVNYQVVETSPFAAVPLAAAVYQPAADAVVLVPSHPMPVAKYAVASGAVGSPSAVVSVTGQAINNAGTGYPNGVLFATFPTSGYSPGIVMQARLLAAHRHQQLRKTLNHVLNPFSWL